MLVHVTRRSSDEESSELARLREAAADLQRRSEAEDAAGDAAAAESLRQEAQRKGKDAIRLISKRSFK